MYPADADDTTCMNVSISTSVYIRLLNQSSYELLTRLISWIDISCYFVQVALVTLKQERLQKKFSFFKTTILYNDIRRGMEDREKSVEFNYLQNGRKNLWKSFDFRKVVTV